MVHNLSPEYLSSKLERRTDTTSYSFQESENKLGTPLSCKKYLRNSFPFSSAVLWNSLPQKLRQPKFLKQVLSIVIVISSITPKRTICKCVNVYGKLD